MTPYRERMLAGHYAAEGSKPEASWTDAAAEKAAELGVDIATVQGTGKDGRVTVTDVQAAADAAVPA